MQEEDIVIRDTPAFWGTERNTLYYGYERGATFDAVLFKERARLYEAPEDVIRKVLNKKRAKFLREYLRYHVKMTIAFAKKSRQKSDWIWLLQYLKRWLRIWLIERLSGTVIEVMNDNTKKKGVVI